MFSLCKPAPLSSFLTAHKLNLFAKEIIRKIHVDFVDTTAAVQENAAFSEDRFAQAVCVRLSRPVFNFATVHNRCAGFPSVPIAWYTPHD